MRVWPWAACWSNCSRLIIGAMYPLGGLHASRAGGSSCAPEGPSLPRRACPRGGGGGSPWTLACAEKVHGSPTKALGDDVSSFAGCNRTRPLSSACHRKGGAWQAIAGMTGGGRISLQSLPGGKAAPQGAAFFLPRRPRGPYHPEPSPAVAGRPLRVSKGGGRSRRRRPGDMERKGLPAAAGPFSSPRTTRRPRRACPGLDPGTDLRAQSRSPGNTFPHPINDFPVVRLPEDRGSRDKGIRPRRRDLLNVV